MKKVFYLVLLVFIAGCGIKQNVVSLHLPPDTPTIITNKYDEAVYQRIAEKLSSLSQYKIYEMKDFFPMIVRNKISQSDWLIIKKTNRENIIILSRGNNKVSALIPVNKNEWKVIILQL